METRNLVTASVSCSLKYKPLAGLSPASSPVSGSKYGIVSRTERSGARDGHSNLLLGWQNVRCPTRGCQNGCQIGCARLAKNCKAFRIMVRPERLELPAYWFEASRSIQLSYGRTRRFRDPVRILSFCAAITGEEKPRPAGECEPCTRAPRRPGSRSAGDRGKT